DDSVVYVVEASGSQFGAFYISTDTGSSFTERNHAGRNYFGYDTAGFQSGGQAPRDMDVTASPLDADEVHIAGVLTWRSLDGGVNFQNTSDWIPQDAASANKGYCHADVDLMLFDDSGIMFVGTDGGIFKAENSTILNSTYYTDITAGLGIKQFYKLGVSQTSDVVISAGSQDNGTCVYKEDIDLWGDWLGADGMESFVSHANVDHLFGTSQNGQLYRSTNGGATYSNLSEPSPGQGAWVTPFEQDPVDAGTLYLGYARVHKSINSGISWTAISQSFGGDLSQMKVAASNSQVMYASRGGFVYKTDDGGATDWTQLPNPGGLINSIAIHPNNPNKIAIATTSFTNPVVVSVDGGATWINYKFNLPAFSALSLVWDDNGKEGLYLGMNYGLFYIDDTFAEWQVYNNNLPNVIVNELDINNVTNMLYAGTYGRGIWASPLVDEVAGVEDLLSQDQVSVYPNPTNSEINIIVQQQVEADIRIFDVLGKLMVYQADIDLGNTNHTIDVSNFTNGIYFVRINSNAGTITKKIMKK
ncbi:MAG: T9SS type A sorting domain-containing protein, partial [Flavobacteriaceae bacterium]|nr:T9SS type A sorting domain-containing protein [Flavobacteriaceae bacterium]